MKIKEQILEWADRFVRLPVAGLDISDRAAKYFKFKSDGTLEIDFFGEVEIPEGIIVSGEIKREEELVHTFEAWLAKEGRHIRGSLLAVSLPEEKGFLRLIQLPKVKREEVSNAIRWEIEAHIPLPSEELVYDYEIVEPPSGISDHLDVVLTAFPKAVVESYLRALKRTGFQPVTLELESQAILRAVLSPPLKLRPLIVVDMGRMRTSFTVFAGGAIIFTTTLDFGGFVLEENIARALGIGRQEAEGVKKEVGLDRRSHDGKVFAALAPAIAALADELQRAVAYYQDRTKHVHGVEQKVEVLLLTGGDASLLGLGTYLSSILKIPVEFANSFAATEERLREAILSIPKQKARTFSTAIGLAMRGIHEVEKA